MNVDQEMKDVSQMCLPPTATIRQAIENIDCNKSGIVLITDDGGRLIGTVTDGDVRRAMLAHRSVESPIAEIVCHSPIIVNPEDSRERVQQLMKLHRLRHIPVVDETGRIVQIWEIQDLVQNEDTFPVAVIVAGGEGQRLRPLTDHVPKPMLKVGELPILENTVLRLVEAGVRKIYISVNYKAEVIEEYFQDGSRLGVEILYLREQHKLGTAGALALMPEIPAGPCLVINGEL